MRRALAAHDPARALTLLDGAGAASARGRVLLLRSRALYALGRRREALAELATVRTDAEISRTDMLRAERAALVGELCLTTTGELDLAIDAFREAAAIGARLGTRAAARVGAWAAGRAAVALARMRAHDAAQRQLELAASLSEVPVDIAVHAADVALSFDDRERARQILDAAFAETSGHAPREVLLALAALSRIRGDLAAAHRWLDEVPILAPSDVRPRRERARCFASDRRWASLEKALAELIAASPHADDVAELELERAGAAWRAGRHDEARATYASLTVAPSSEDATRRARLVFHALSRPQAVSAAPAVRLETFPTVVQLRGHCGPAVCELLLRHFGVAAEQTDIAAKMGSRVEGTPIYAMRAFLEGAGMHVRRIEASLDRVRTCLSLGLPVILDEEHATSRHVVVATGFDDARQVLDVQDPMAHEVRETPYSDLDTLLAMSSHGAIVACPAARSDLLAALDQARVVEARHLQLADEAFRACDEGDLVRARLHVDRSIAARPDYALAWMCKHRIARNLTGPERDAALEAILGEIANIWPTSEWPEQLLGYTRFEQGRIEEALLAFERARARDEADGESWAMIAECAARLGRDEDAAMAAHEALRRIPSHTEAIVLLAGCCVRRGEIGRARVLVEVALEVSSGARVVHDLAAELAERCGEPESALASLRASRAAEASREEPTWTQVRLLLACGKAHEARSLARALAPHAEPRDLVDAAERFLAAGAPVEAESLARSSAQDDTLGAEARAVAAEARARRGDMEGAEAELLAVLTDAPVARAYAALGAIARDTGRRREAIERFAAAVGHDPVAGHRVELACALDDAGFAHEGARHAADSGLRRTLRARDLVRLAHVVEHDRGQARALAWLLQAHASRHGDPEPLRAVATYLLDDAFFPDVAAPFLDRLVDLGHDDRWSRMHRGVLAMHAARAHEALGEAWLRACIAEAPTWAAPRALLAAALVRLGRASEARALVAPLAPAFPRASVEVAALLAEDDVDGAREILTRFSDHATASTQGDELALRIARHVGDDDGVARIADGLSRAQGELRGDGRLGRWEREKFASLLSRGASVRAARFAAGEIGTVADALVLAGLCLRAGALELAMHFHAEATALDPYARTTRLLDATLRELAGRGDAEPLWRELADEEPTDATCQRALAELALARGDVEAAARAAAIASNFGHLHAPTCVLHACVGLARGDRELAVRELARARALFRAVPPRLRDLAPIDALEAALAGDTATAGDALRRGLGQAVLRSPLERTRMERTLASLGVTT